MKRKCTLTKYNRDQAEEGEIKAKNGTKDSYKSRALLRPSRYFFCNERGHGSIDRIPLLTSVPFLSLYFMR